MLPTTYFIRVADKLKPTPNPNNFFFSRASKFNTQVSKVSGKDKVNKIKTKSEEEGHIERSNKWASALEQEAVLPWASHLIQPVVFLGEVLHSHN